MASQQALYGPTSFASLTALAQGAPGLPDRQAGAFSASRFHLAGARRADFICFAHCAGGRRAKPASWQALIPWRTERDSNPRYAINVYSLSRGAPSATRPPVHRFGEPSARRAKPASWQALLASATCPSVLIAKQGSLFKRKGGAAAENCAREMTGCAVEL